MSEVTVRYGHDKDMRFPTAAFLVCLLTIAGCSRDEGPGPVPTDTASPEPAPTLTTATPTATPTETVTYGDDEGLVNNNEAAAALPEAPDDFKSFLASELVDAKATQPSGDCGDPEFRVSSVSPGGWAAGTFFQARCDGHAVLWAQSGGAQSSGGWSEVWNGQTIYDCSVLEQYNFPASVVGNECFDGAATVSYPR